MSTFQTVLRHERQLRLSRATHVDDHARRSESRLYNLRLYIRLHMRVYTSTYISIVIVYSIDQLRSNLPRNVRTIRMHF